MANMMTELQSACSARKPIRTGSGLLSGALCGEVWVGETRIELGGREPSGCDEFNDERS